MTAPDADPAVLLVNTRSRSGRELYAEAHRLLTERKVRLADVQPVLRPGRLAQLVRDELARGVRRLIVGGGDGTLSGAVAAMQGTDAVLGVLPLGTGNDFARGLGIPLKDLPAACDVIARGHTASVDLGLVNDRCFLNAASIGLTAAVARRLTGALKRKLGALAYPVASLAEAWQLEPFEVELDEGGSGFKGTVLQVVIGNGRYHGGGHLIAPEAGFQDGQLDVYLVLAPDGGAPRSRWAKLRLLAGVGFHLKRGKHVEHAQVWHVRTRACEVRSQPPLALNIDGELSGQTPARFEVKPRALRVLVPSPPA